MNLEKLDRKDLRLIAICAVVAVISAYVGVKYFFQAFPEASIEFKTTKESSLPIAKGFLTSMNIDTAGSRHASVFGFDDETKVFLERELGVDDAKKLLDSTVRLWRWQHRWFRPLEKEEYRVDVTTKGEPVGFDHFLAEEVPGKDLPQADARALAERFLTGTMGRGLDDLIYVAGTTQKRPHRTDHLFTWKLKGLYVKGADYRMEVGVAGDQTVRYREYLRVPDTWMRDYEHLRSKNTMAGAIDTALLLLTAVAMLVLLVIRLRGGDIRWRAAGILAAVTFVLEALSALNSFPSDLFERYVTTTSYPAFIITELLGALMSGLLYGAVIFLIASAAEPLYRDRFPRFLSLQSLLRGRALRTKEYFLASVVGITLTFFFFAYENVFYIIANHFGAWAPREVAYSDLLSTAFPFVFVLFFGWFPAISEEFISRMFSIPFFERLMRSRIAAILVAAFIWGFGHAAYPNQPFWIRGLEVGLAGIVFGLIVLRFGIAAVVICHFSVDALYTAFVLIRSSNLYYVVSGSLAAGIFAVIFIGVLIAYVRKGGFLAPEHTNAEEAVLEPPAVGAGAGLDDAAAAGAIPGAGLEGGSPLSLPQAVYRPLSAGRIAAGLVIAAVLVGLIAAPLARFGDWVDFQTDRGRAKESGATFLRGAGFYVSGYRRAATVLDRTDPTAAAYLLEKGGVETASEVYKDKVPTPLWRIRYFIPGQHEEFSVSVDPRNGQAIGFSRDLPEDAPGAILDKDQALATAEAFVKARGQDPAAGELKDQSAKDEKARRDHSLAWEYPIENPSVAAQGRSPSSSRQVQPVDEAKVRYEVVVQGDKVGDWGRVVKIPEEWERARDRETVLSTILRYLKIPVIGILAGLALMLLVMRIRMGAIPWRFALVVGVLMAGVVLLSGSLRTDAIWASPQGYRTSMPAAGFWVLIGIGLFASAVLFMLLAAAAAGLAASLYPQARTMFSREGRRMYARDALVAGGVAAGCVWGIPALTHVLTLMLPAGRLIEGVSYPRTVDASQPWLAVVMSVAFWTLLGPALGAIGAFILTHQVRIGAARAALAVTLIVSFLPADARKPQELIFAALALAIVGAAYVLLAKLFLRDNPLAWVMAFWLGMGVVSAVDLVSQSAPLYRWNGAIALVLLLVPVVLLLPDALRGHPAAAGQVTQPA